MTKTELIETYTAEQFAEMVINYSTSCFQSNVFNSLKNEIESPLKKSIEDSYKTQIKQKEEEIYKLEKECEELQSEVEKYRKAFEEAKNERDCRITECRKKIEELTDEKESFEMRLKLLKGERDDLREEVEKIKKTKDFSYLTPIEVANMMINAEGEYEHNPLAKALYKEDKGTYRIFDIGELRQIAEHLLVYCNHNGEVDERYGNAK